MLHSMTIRLIHVHQLETLYLYYGVKYQPGVIWGHRGQKVIFSKNATFATEYMTLSPLCNIVYPCYSYICISLKPFIAFMGSRSTCGVISAGRVCRLCRAAVSSFFFFLANTSLGSFGVTGVKMLFPIKVSSPTDYVAWSRYLCTW